MSFLFNSDHISKANLILEELGTEMLAIEEMTALLTLTDNLPLKKQASLVKKFLSAKGRKLKLGRCQEFIARLKGYPDFGEMKKHKSAFQMGDIDLESVNPNYLKDPIMARIAQLKSWSNEPYPLLPKNLPEDILMTIREEFRITQLGLDVEENGCINSLMIVLYMLSKVQGDSTIRGSDDEFANALNSLWIECTLLEMARAALIEYRDPANTYAEMLSTSRTFSIKLVVPQSDQTQDITINMNFKELFANLDFAEILRRQN